MYRKSNNMGQLSKLTNFDRWLESKAVTDKSRALSFRSVLPVLF